jgi:tRNA threonylcarbamoyladenosine biosynthesis protein TsaE
MALVDKSPSIVTVPLADQAATEQFAARVALLLAPGDLVCLSGSLGAGKTVFARGVVTTLATKFETPIDEVPSPTFTLVQLYDFPAFMLYHFDLYRIKRAEEVFELGIEDALAEGVSLIEWPERMGILLPTERLDIDLQQGPTENARIATVTPHEGWVARLAGERFDV